MPQWWLIVLVTAAVTYVLTVVVRQFTTAEKKVNHALTHRYAVADEQFRRSIGILLPPALVGGNRVTPLVNGDEIFPAMLAAVRGARRTLTFETFIYWSGRVGREFADALAERARAGVKVHVLLDWVGTKSMDRQLLADIEDAGVQVERYHPPRWYTLDRLNNRTHRKILVADGRVGFTGGVGIADEWTGSAQDPDHWRDSHFRVEGPAVAQLQAAFMDNWLKTHADVLHGPDYFPALEPVGDVLAHVFKSSPAEGSQSLRLMYMLALTAAAKNVRLASAYFVPDDLSVATLVAARKRGVTVEVVVPGPNIDTHITRLAGRSRWGPLLEAGVEIYEYQPTMYHTKVLVIDDLWVSVGSTNFDNRSFRLNDECNLNVLDAGLAADQVRCFEEDKDRSRRITLEEWERRPRTEKLKERAAGLLRSQL